jgi:fibronectin-binding autotransporter adhesin
MATIKITELTSIGANLTSSTVIPVVNMSGTPTTEKTLLGNIANVVLAGAGGNYTAAAVSILAQSVTNAAQPNITSVGTLTNLTISGNVTVNGNITSNGTAYVGNLSTTGLASITTLTVGATANLGAVGNITITGGTAGQVLSTNGNGVLSWASDATTYGNSNVAAYLPTYTGDIGGNVVTANLFSGNGSSLSAITGANVSGFVPNANVANTAFAVAASNVSGLGNIAVTNYDGNSSNVLRGDGTWAPDASGTYGDSNVVTLLSAFGSNTISTTGIITGDGGGLSNVPYANVTGTPTLGNIATLNLDGNVSNLLTGNGTYVAIPVVPTVGNIATINLDGNSQTWLAGNGVFANIAIPTVGNIATINLDGNSSNVLRGDGTFSADANSSYGDSNVVSLLAAFGSNTIVTTGIITADGANLSNVPYANLTGAPSLGNIATINLDGNVSNLLTGNGTYVAIPTVPSVGNIATLNLDGNASNVLRGDGTFGADANSNYGDSNVTSLLGAFGSNSITTTGNIELGNLVFSNTQIQSSAYAGGNGHAMMIDTNRTDDYEANGSADKPFKTFMAAVEAVADLNPGGTVPYTFILMGCSINETVDLSSYNFNFITISTTCRSVFNDPVIIGNSALKQLTVRNVEFGDTLSITGDGTTDQLNNTSFYNVTFSGALTVTAANALAFYEAAFFSTVTLNNITYLYVNGAQFNDDWTIRADDTGAYPIPAGGIAPGVSVLLDFIANNIIFVKGGTGSYVFQPQAARMGRNAGTYTLPAGWILTAYSSVFIGTWTNSGTWTMRNSSSVNAIAGTAPTYSGTIGGATAILTTGNITTINSGLLQNGNSNITLTANGNVSIQAAGSTVELVVTSTGANVTGTLDATGNITGGNISTTGNITGGNIIGNGNTLSNVAIKETGNWTLASGVNTVSISVPANGTYAIWINGNIPNGIATYTATAVVTNTNVPVLGEQYAWYYEAGNALVFTSIPDQFVGTQGAISNATPYLGNTANVFTFGITNNSGSSQVVDWGYTKL